MAVRFPFIILFFSYLNLGVAAKKDKIPLAHMTSGGSTTLFGVMQELAKKFEREHPDSSFDITESSSGEGINDLFEGKIDLARASRRMNDAEISRFKAKKIAVKSFQIGYDALVVATHSDLQKTLKKLSVDEVKKIFGTGEIHDWSQLSPQLSGPIHVIVGRESKSGTASMLLERLEQLHFVPNARVVNSTTRQAEEVTKDNQAITYLPMGIAQASSAFIVPIETADGLIVFPSRQSIKEGTYPFYRPLFFISHIPIRGDVVKFLQFVLSDQGQAIVDRAGMLPVRSKEP